MVSSPSETTVGPEVATDDSASSFRSFRPVDSLTYAAAVITTQALSRRIVESFVAGFDSGAPSDTLSETWSETSSEAAGGEAGAETESFGGSDIGADLSTTSETKEQSTGVFQST